MNVEGSGFWGRYFTPVAFGMQRFLDKRVLAAE